MKSFIAFSVAFIGVTFTGCSTLQPRVYSEPPGAKLHLVSVHGVQPFMSRAYIGETPIQEFLLPEGFNNSDEFKKYLDKNKKRLYVEIESPGYQVKTVPLTKLIAADEDEDYKKTAIKLEHILDVEAIRGVATKEDVLSKVYKNVTVQTNMSGAIVYMNGVLSGNTPLTLSQLPGTYLLEVRHSQCKHGVHDIVRIKNTMEPNVYKLNLQGCEKTH